MLLVLLLVQQQHKRLARVYGLPEGALYDDLVYLALRSEENRVRHLVLTEGVLNALEPLHREANGRGERVREALLLGRAQDLLGSKGGRDRLEGHFLVRKNPPLQNSVLENE